MPALDCETRSNAADAGERSDDGDGRQSCGFRDWLEQHEERAKEHQMSSGSTRRISAELGNADI